MESTNIARQTHLTRNLSCQYPWAISSLLPGLEGLSGGEPVGLHSQTVSSCQVARERTSLCGRGSSADCPGLPRPTWKGAPAARGLGSAWLGTWWAADVAERAKDTGPRPRCAPQRIHPGDRQGEPGPHGQNRRPPKSDQTISNRPDKLLGTHPLSWFSSRLRYCRLARLPKSGGISPLNWFSPRDNRRRLASFPNSGGISPLNWLMSSSSSVTRPLSSVVTPYHSLIGTSLSQLLFPSQFGPPVAL